MSVESKVVNLDSYRRIDHVVEKQECRNCGHRQVSVQPEQFETFMRQWWECSACKKMTCMDVNGIRPEYPHER